MNLLSLQNLTRAIYFCCGLAIYWVWSNFFASTAEQMPAPLNTLDTAQQHKTHSIENENTRLLAEIDRLNQLLRIEQQRERSSVTTNQNTTAKDSSIDSDHIQAEISKQVAKGINAEREAQNFIEKFISVKDGASGTYEERLIEDFNNEKRDPDWAPVHETKLYDLFEASEELSDVALEQLDCRSERCRLQIFTAQQEDIEAAIEALSTVLQNDEALSESSISVAENLAEGHTSLILH